MVNLVLGIIIVCSSPQIQVSQEGSTWIIICSAEGVNKETAFRLDGWVSNSRVPYHSTSKQSILTDKISECTLIENITDELRCKEKLSAVADKNLLTLRVEHLHGIYGPLNPLVGKRKLTLNINNRLLETVIDFKEDHVVYPAIVLSIPPEEKRSKDYSVSPGGDSLYLRSNIPGCQYYRFAEISVRYASRMKLTFYYLIANGTENECSVRLSQYKDSPSSWRKLDNASIDQKLTIVGKWKKKEIYFYTEKEATTVVIEFKITGASEVGEMWVDCVGLEYVDKLRENGP